MAAQGQECDVCGSHALSQTDTGFLVCDECGTQSQLFIEEMGEWDGGGGRGNRRKKSLTQAELDRRATLEEMAAQDDGPSFPLRERVLAYVECFQGALQDHADVMVRDKGCPKELREVVRRVWFSYLETVDMLGPTYGGGDVFAGAAVAADLLAEDGVLGEVGAPGAPKAAGEGGNAEGEDEGEEEEEEEEGSQGEDGEGEEEDGGGDGGAVSGSQYIRDLEGELEGGGDGYGEDDLQLAQGPPEEEEEEEEEERMDEREFLVHLEKRLPMALVPGLCYLACLWLREAVLPHDIVSWICKGELPLLSAHARCPAASLEKMPRGSLRVSVIPSPRQVAAVAAAASRVVGMALPPLNAPLLARRYIRELELPASLGPVCDRLLALHPRPEALRICPEDVAQPLPHRAGLPSTAIMAVVLVALKLAHTRKDVRPVKDTKRAPGPLLAPPPEGMPGSWRQWARARLLAHEGPGGWLWQVAEGAGHGGGALTGARYCLDHALAGASPPPDLKEHFDAFRGVIDGGGDGGGGGGGGRGSGSEGGGGVGGGVGGGGGGSGGGGGGGLAAPAPPPPESPGPSAAAGRRGRKRGAPGDVALVEADAAAAAEAVVGAVAEAVVGMEAGAEAGGMDVEADGPRLHVVYPVGISGGGDGEAWGAGRLQPDYLAVLYALATHAWVRPPALHHAARILEAEMLYMEKLWEPLPVGEGEGRRRG